jgi:hypothetical protein
MRPIYRVALGTIGMLLLIGSNAEVGAEPLLRISIPNHRTVFQQGEVIPLDLSFTARTSNRFQMASASPIRFSLSSHERLVVRPAKGTIDPLSVYFKYTGGAFMGSGDGGVLYLSDAPNLVHAQVNQWVRFDEPGTYRITAVSTRVTEARASSQAKPMELASNAIAVRIVRPNLAWQRAELDRVRVLLTKPGRPESSESEYGPYTSALTSLEYLGTADAARELALLLGRDEKVPQRECMFGLIGSSNRSAGLDELQRLFREPDTPVTRLFLDAMVLLSLDPNASFEMIREGRQAKLEQLRWDLLNNLPLKTGDALTISSNTLAELAGPISR